MLNPHLHCTFSMSITRLMLNIHTYVCTYIRIYIFVILYTYIHIRTYVNVPTCTYFPQAEVASKVKNIEELSLTVQELKSTQITVGKETGFSDSVLPKTHKSALLNARRPRTTHSVHTSGEVRSSIFAIFMYLYLYTYVRTYVDHRGKATYVDHRGKATYVHCTLYSMYVRMYVCNRKYLLISCLALNQLIPNNEACLVTCDIPHTYISTLFPLIHLTIAHILLRVYVRTYVRTYVCLMLNVCTHHLTVQMTHVVR